MPVVARISYHLLLGAYPRRSRPTTPRAPTTLLASFGGVSQAAVYMGSVYVLGILMLPFLRETKDEPLLPSARSSFWSMCARVRDATLSVRQVPFRDLERGEAMMLSVGDRIPDVPLMRMTGEGPAPVGSGEALGSGAVVLFGVPGAFTPTCSDQHLPGFVRRASELRAKGVDTLACIAVNDVFVLTAWAASVGASDEVVMLGDGNGAFAAAAGLELDGSGFGLGTRSQRYAAILDNGVVRQLMVEPDPLVVTVSSVDTVLDAL